MSASFSRLPLTVPGAQKKRATAPWLLFGHYASRSLIIIRGLEICWLVVSSFLIFALSRPISGAAHSAPWAETIAITLIYLFALFLMDLRDLDPVEDRYELVLNLCAGMGIVCLGIAVAQLTFGILVFSLPLILAQVGLTAAIILSVRTLVLARLSRRSRGCRVGFVGSESAFTALDKEQLRLSNLGVVLQPLGDSVAEVVLRVDVEPQLRDLRLIVIEDTCLKRPEICALIEKCHRADIEAISLSAFYERAFSKVALCDSILINLRVTERDAARAIGSRLRRWRDIVLALLASVIAVPFGFILAIAIKWDSPGPIFFTQERIGQNGRPFRMIKFRSMHNNIRVVRGHGWTTEEDDPRITRIGALMRPFHLDEVPQLINVLRGEMSLVGPRPFHPTHSARLATTPFFRLRLLIPPGITGWAQIRCSYAASLEDHQEVLARDLFYVKHAGLLFDLFVLIETMRVCLWKKGAR